MFDLVEQIRRTAVRYRRDQDGDSMTGFESTIGALDPAQATSVVRAGRALPEGHGGGPRLS